jgi:hypothetical protein
MVRKASSKPDSGTPQSTVTICIEADFIPEHADTFHRDLHPDLTADYVLASPPFNYDHVHWQFAIAIGPNSNN